MPLALSLVRLRKKLTVMGMMGHTQGVNSASNPPANPIRNRNHSEPFCSLRPSCCCNSWTTGCHKSVLTATLPVSTDVGRSVSAAMLCTESGTRDEGESPSFASFSVGSCGVVVATMAGDFPAFLKATSCGGMHVWSLQAPYSK